MDNITDDVLINIWFYLDTKTSILLTRVSRRLYSFRDVECIWSKKLRHVPDSLPAKVTLYELVARYSDPDNYFLCPHRVIERNPRTNFFASFYVL